MYWIYGVAAAAVLVAIGCVIFFIKRKRGGRVDAPVTIDSVVGVKCVVDERIDNGAGCGQVTVGGQSWSARAVDSEKTYEVGEVLRVVAIEGAKLICRK